MAWRVLSASSAARYALPAVRAPLLRCAAARGSAASAERDAAMRGVLPEHREVVGRALEQASDASAHWEVALTDFLEPPAAADCQLAVGRLADCEARPWGGYEHAERVRLRLGRPEVLDETPLDGVVAVLNVQGSFVFDAATHRDFLGAVLGTGIDRNRVGDIVVQGDRGAHVLTTPEMGVYLSSALAQVRSVRVLSDVVPLEQLRVTPAKADTIRTAEASLRLDAIASAGFRTSRGKMADLIEAGDVRLNWRSQGVKTSQVVKTGDVISVRGKGRVTVGEVAVTKKERYSVELHRLI
jgi:photosystem II S4 domain protein